MGRLDWKRTGRFDIDHETDQIQHAMRGWQASSGDEVEYYRFREDLSQEHPVYDEAFGAGRVFDGPIELPVLHVVDREGTTDDTGGGFYYNDEISFTASFEEISRTGLTEMDIRHQTYLKDRVVYNGKIFRITGLSILGQVQRRDLVVAAQGSQLKPDELVNDPQFLKFVDPTATVEWQAPAPPPDPVIEGHGPPPEDQEYPNGTQYIDLDTGQVWRMD